MVRNFKGTFMQVTKILLDEKNRMLRAGFGLHDGKKFFRIDLWKVAYRFTRKEPTKQEQSLRTGLPGDEQFTKFVQPQDATIQLLVSSDTRQAGMQRLMRSIAQHLVDEGYINVDLAHADGSPMCCESFMPAERSLAERQKRVRINLRLK